MKKLFTLLTKTLLVAVCLLGGASYADATTYKITYNGSDAGSTTYFGYSGNHNFNTKFKDCTYDGTTFTSGLKMEGSSVITFTNTNTATVTVVQSTWSNKGIKLDGTSIANSTASTATTGAYIYTISDVAAGSHTIVRDGGELGIFQVTVVEAAGTEPTITTQPASATYVVDASPAALTVEASASAGDLSYQWYSNTTGTADPLNDSAIDGATSATLAAANISTASTGTTYYYVVVTDDNGSTTSDLATITVVTGIAPDVSAAISASAVRAGTTVTLTATVSAGIPAPTLQWYTCDADGTNEADIDGATNTTYQPSTASTGIFYFKVKAHNDSGDDYSDVLKLTVIAQGVEGTVSDLVEISSNYTFIADNHTANGTVGFSSGYLYDDKRIFSPLGNSVATNKGTSTIDGNIYNNSLRVKSSSQDVLAFKVGGPCFITFYTENPGKSRAIKVGNDVDDDSYGTISDANEDHIVFIPSASKVYLTCSSDRFIAGYKVTFTVPVTPAKEYTTLTSAYNLDFTSVSSDLKAYIATEVSGGSVQMTQVNKVPANTGLVLKATTPGSAVNVPVFDGTGAEDVSTNKMAGSATVTTAIAANGGYILSDGVFQPALAGTLAAGKAYLNIAVSPSAPILNLSFDTTGINQVENGKMKVESSEVYNLNGQRVAQPTKGLYIVNGKKVIIK